MLAKECNNLYGELIRENIRLKAKLKEQAKQIFEDINIGYFKKMIQSGYDSKKDLLCLLELLIRLQEKWVGKE